MTLVNESYVTAKEALKAAKLDFKVEKHPIFAHIFPKNKKEPGFDSKRVLDRYATIRMDTMTPIGDVGSVYTVVQNEDAFEFIDSVANQYEVLFKSVYELRDGALISVKAHLGDSVGLKEDVVKKTLILSNSHNGTRKVTVKFVIENVKTKAILPFTLPTLDTELEIRHTHSVNDKMMEGKRTMQAAHNAFAEIVKVFEKMAEKEVDLKDAYLFVEELLHPDKKTSVSTRTKNVIDAIMGILMREKNINLWKLYNAIAEYTDTQKGSKKPESNQIDSRLFGSGNGLKEKSFEKIVKLI